MSIHVDIVNRTGFRVEARWLRRLVRQVLRGEGVSAADISLALVDDFAIANVNQRFLNHTGPTDVITFPLSDERDTCLCGEIVVSVDMARWAAKELGHSIRSEIALYVIHGLLHLCGYDDKKAADRQRMREGEAHYLHLLELGARAGRPRRLP
jgi:probable rRNA maturation factor